MKQAKFSLADLFTILGSFVFGIICYISLNFLFLGENLPSIAGAITIFFLLGGLTYGARLLKRTIRNFKTCIIWEWILIALFVVFAILAVFPFSHYFNVLNKKGEIQQKVVTLIEQAERMFEEYEEYANTRETIYKSRLQSVVYAKGINKTDYYDMGFVDGTADNIQIDNKMFILHNELFPSNYEGENGMKEVAKGWLSNAKKTLSNNLAFTFGIVKVLTQLQVNITQWENELKQYSKFRAQGEDAEDFSNRMIFENIDNVKEIVTTNNFKPTGLSIILALSIYALIILSYIITRRDTRYPGLKVIFSSGEKKENEL